MSSAASSRSFSILLFSIYSSYFFCASSEEEYEYQKITDKEEIKTLAETTEFEHEDVIKIPNHKLNNNIKPISLKKNRTRTNYADDEKPANQDNFQRKGKSKLSEDDLTEKQKRNLNDGNGI